MKLLTLDKTSHAKTDNVFHPFMEVLIVFI